MVASIQVPKAPAQSRDYRCPSCGSRLTRDERPGTTGLLARLFFLRGLRCKPACGWRGLRFSRSRFRQRKRHLISALFVVLFIAVAAWTVRYVLSRAASVPGGTGDDGIQEVD